MIVSAENKNKAGNGNIRKVDANVDRMAGKAILRA